MPNRMLKRWRIRLLKHVRLRLLAYHNQYRSSGRQLRVRINVLLQINNPSHRNSVPDLMHWFGIICLREPMPYGIRAYHNQHSSRRRLRYEQNVLLRIDSYGSRSQMHSRKRKRSRRWLPNKH